MGSQFTSIQESMVNKQHCVELGLSCADVCEALDRGLKGRRPGDLSQSVLGAIQKLTTWVETTVHGSSDWPSDLSIIGPWQKLRGRSSNKVDEM